MGGKQIMREISATEKSQEESSSQRGYGRTCRGGDFWMKLSGGESTAGHTGGQMICCHHRNSVLLLEEGGRL